MKLIIENLTHKNLKPFILNYVIPMASQILYSIMDKKQIKKIDNYISKFYNINIGAAKIIDLGIKNLIIQNMGNTYQLQIDPNIVIPKTSAKLYDICALINYGNVEIPPYPIFDNTMNKLAQFIPSLYDEYGFGG